MSSLKRFIIATAIFTLVSWVMSNPVANPNSIKYIGEADGKSFFAEVNVTMTWQEAKAYCMNAGMHLSTIETVNQADLLVDRLFKDYGNSGYWTAGRDRRTIEGYVWDTTGQVVNNSVAKNAFHGLEGDYYSCIRAYVYNATDIHFHSNTCNSTFFTLCSPE